jgi:hypothetical protein
MIDATLDVRTRHAEDSAPVSTLQLLPGTLIQRGSARINRPAGDMA